MLDIITRPGPPRRSLPTTLPRTLSGRYTIEQWVDLELEERVIRVRPFWMKIDHMRSMAVQLTTMGGTVGPWPTRHG